jgi:eukaryotic translation initiation factor 2C
MRFFASNPADADRTGNLPPGTVVEKGVTHPYAFDFYRMSPSGIC